MQWLTPLTAVYAAAAAVPLLLLLYFLKLKRAERLVSCTLLWKRAVQDLQVNAPFQKIRRNILLLLQLLMLFAILASLGRPVLSLMAGPGRRHVLLIDRSASMTAADIDDGSSTRLEAAKRQARIFIESLRGSEFFSLTTRADQAMVVAFDKGAKVMCNFTSDKGQLLAAIDAITPSHKSSSLSEAVAIAQAFAQSGGEEANNRSAEQKAQLILFSDGRIHDTDQVAVAAGGLVFNCIGQSGDNVAVTAMQARRSYENPEEVNVFATVSNYGDEPVTTDVQMSLDGDVRAVRSVTIPPGGAAGGDSNQPGRVAVNFSLTYAEAGLLEVRQLKTDTLSCDDAAWAVLPQPKRLSVLLVTAGNMILESALKAAPLAHLEICPPEQFAEVEQLFDVIVLDDFAPVQLPRCRYLVFGKPPADIDVKIEGLVQNQVMVDWQTRHPALRYANLANLFAAECYEMNLPRDADVLAEFNDTAAIAALRRAGSVFLLVGFDVLKTNWPFEPSFVLFCYNALAFMGVEFGVGQNNLQAGEPIVLDGLGPEATAQINGPDISGAKIQTTPAGSLRVPYTDKVGVYNIALADQPPRLFAVNLLDSAESDIEPVREIRMSGGQVHIQAGSVARANLPLWPYLVGSALLLACLEWLVYNSKVRI